MTKDKNHLTISNLSRSNPEGDGVDPVETEDSPCPKLQP